MAVSLNPPPCPSTAQGVIRTITASGRVTRLSDLSKVAEWTAEPASSFLAGATWAAVGAPPGGGTLKGPHHSPPAAGPQEGASHRDIWWRLEAVLIIRTWGSGLLAAGKHGGRSSGCH